MANVGRPSIYSEEILRKAQEYIDMPLYETYTKEIVVKDQIQVINAERPSSIPSVAGLALRLDVSRETIYRWSKEEGKEEFCDTLRRLHDKQKEYLLYHGLLRNYDSGFAKFVAINMTDMRDKVETENTNKEIKVILPDERATKL